MSSKGPRRSGHIVIGGSVTGSLVGDGNRDVTITTTGATSSASLDDLRAAIASLRAELEATGGTALAGDTAPADQVRAELGRFEEEIGTDDPDGEMVGIRWKLVQRLLVPLQHVAGIAQAADRILALTRSLFGGN